MIEKNIRLQPHHSRDLLVGRRSDGRRPGYQPPGHRDAPSPSSSGSGGGGGGHAQHATANVTARPAPAPAPDRQDRARQQAEVERVAEVKQQEARVSPQQSMAMTGNTSLAGKTQSQAQASVDRDNAMRSAEGKVDVGFQEVLRKQKVKEDILNDPKVDEGFKRYIRQPETFETPDREGIFSKLDPKEMAKNQAKKMVKNKVLKELGLAPFSLPLSIGSWLFGKIAPDKKAALKSKFKAPKFTGSKYDKLNPNEMKNVRTRRETPEDRDGVQPTLAQTITGGTGLKSGQELLGMDDKQIQQIYQGRDLLKQTIESGMYQDRKLNMNEIKMLQAHMMKMESLIQNIESYQVKTGAAHGGLIDQPFTGRSRDI